MKSNEGQLQSACIKWFRLQYPKLKPYLFAVPNGGSRNKIEAVNLKRQGVLPGVADIIFLWPSGPLPFLCIEMKYGNGKQSKEQRQWQYYIENTGGKYVICNSLDSFMNEINTYLNEKN